MTWRLGGSGEERGRQWWEVRGRGSWCSLEHWSREFARKTGIWGEIGIKEDSQGALLCDMTLSCISQDTFYQETHSCSSHLQLLPCFYSETLLSWDLWGGSGLGSHAVRTVVTQAEVQQAPVIRESVLCLIPFRMSPPVLSPWRPSVPGAPNSHCELKSDRRAGPRAGITSVS